MLCERGRDTEQMDTWKNLLYQTRLRMIGVMLEMRMRVPGPRLDGVRNPAQNNDKCSRMKHGIGYVARRSHLLPRQYSIENPEKASRVLVGSSSQVDRIIY
jgi:hypothetical protein